MQNAPDNNPESKPPMATDELIAQQRHENLVAAVQKALAMIAEHDIESASELVALAIAMSADTPNLRIVLRRAKQNIRMHFLDSAKQFLDGALAELVKE